MLGTTLTYSLGILSFIVLFLVIEIRAHTVDSCQNDHEKFEVCVQLSRCRPIAQMVHNYKKSLAPEWMVIFLRNSHCGSFRNEVYVCCEWKNISKGKKNPKPEQLRLNFRKSTATSDADIRTGMAILRGTDCGFSYQYPNLVNTKSRLKFYNLLTKQIMDFQNHYVAELPWMALLVYSDGVSVVHGCGGTLITKRYVLTAAHCIVSSKILLSVRLGVRDTRKTFYQQIDVEEAIVHANYSRDFSSNDIGLIRLKKDAQFNTGVQPICLPITDSSQKTTSNRMIIAGYGDLNGADLQTNILQMAEVPIRSIDYCKQKHPIMRFDHKFMCAGGENGIDTCPGDSGGPLFDHQYYRQDIRWIQYGIIVGGGRNCSANFPSYFAKISSYTQWIAGNIKH